MNRLEIIVVRDILQRLLDNYQVQGPALEPVKNAIVILDTEIATPEAVAVAPAPASAPVVDITPFLDPVNQINARLNTISAAIAALTPAPAQQAAPAAPAAAAAGA